MSGSDEERHLSVRSNMVWNSVGSLFYLLCSWLTTVLVVVLSSDYAASGQLAVAMSVGNVLASIILFRVRPVQVSDYGSTGETEDYVANRFVTTVLSIVAIVPYMAVTVSADYYVLVGMYLFFKAGESFVDVYHGVFQINDRLDYCAKSQILRGILLVVGFVAGLVVWDSLLLGIALMAASTVLVVLCYDAPRAARYGSIAPKFSVAIQRSILLKCLPGFAASLIATVVVSIARQTYGLEYGMDSLGIYAAVATPTVIVQACASYLYVPLLGPIAKNWLAGDRKAVRGILGKFVAGFIAVVILIYLAFMVLGEPFLRIVYGAETAAYSYLFGPMIACTAATALIGFVIDVLVVMRSYRAPVAVAGASLAIVLMIQSQAFSMFGMNGISIAVLVAYLIPLVMAFVCIAYRLKWSEP